MTIIRFASAVTLASTLAVPAAAQQPVAPPAPPVRLDLHELGDRLSQLEWDLSHIQLPDLSHIQMPDLSHIQLPPMPHPPAVAWHAVQVPQPSSQPSPQPSSQPSPQPPFQRTARGMDARGYESLYDQARSQIEQNQYDRAIQTLDRIITGGGAQAPGAMYWKAYSLSRTSRRSDALTTLASLRQQFPKSPWLRDAQALEVELQQASGQAVDAAAQNTDDLKLLALRGLMQTEPESAMPTIEQMLAGSSSVRVKDRALFLVSQSRSARARALLVGVAKGNNNPDLQLRAIRYIGQMGGADSAQTLDEVYRSTGDERVKREIIRALGNTSAKERLVALAQKESSADLRGEAARTLGNMNAGNELEQLYKSESSADVKRRILQGLQNTNAVDKLTAIARTETDAELKRSAINYIGNIRGAAAADTLVSLYGSETSVEVKRSIVNALSSHNSGAALVSLARAEKNPEMKAFIVGRMGNMRSPEARDYLLELLK